LNGAAQAAGQKTTAFTMTAAMTAVAQYTANSTGYTLTVQSTPPTGLSVGSSTADGGTTNYSVASVAQGASVNLQAPATDPAGYTFSQWMLNGTAQPAGQKSLTFTMTAATTAVAQYAATSGYVLTVQSTPRAGVVIASSTGYAGTTNYAIPGVARGKSVNLAAPATDPAGYIFLQWTLNGTAQPAGQKSITFTMTASATAIAQYKPVMCVLDVESTPLTDITISSATGQGGATNYSMQNLAYGTSVTLAAPASDPTGYTFSQWTLNGTAQPQGQKTISFTMDATMLAAVAQYTPLASE
jgi:hypothetical protein